MIAANAIEKKEKRRPLISTSRAFLFLSYLAPNLLGVSADLLPRRGQIEGTIVAGLAVKSFEFSDEVEKRGWFLIFVFFWTTQFIVAYGQIVIALTIVKYYFTRDEGSVRAFTVLDLQSRGLQSNPKVPNLPHPVQAQITVCLHVRPWQVGIMVACLP